MLLYLQIIFFFLLLMILHELGHVFAAKFLKLEIKKIGFQTKPYPHFFVAASWPRTNYEKRIYLFAGMLITNLLFIISLYFNFFDIRSLLIAFIIQIILETNPFYSDITIAIVSSIKKLNYGKSYGMDYKKEFSKFQYSKYWYLHFFIWTIIITLLIKLYYFL